MKHSVPGLEPSPSHLVLISDFLPDETTRRLPREHRIPSRLHITRR
jgi:hypothetical protein